jgi:peptidoglycan/xylan/chitin deacetylase (PgdA/CDA1 family)
MNVAQLKELLLAGMTVGGHGRSHTDLTKLPFEQARAEIAGCKEDLQQALGVPVQFFAYPGGAFNREIVRLTHEAGYTAACSVLGPALNDRSSLFWLYRDVLSEGMDTWHDRYRLNSLARRLLSFRVSRRLKVALNR